MSPERLALPPRGHQFLTYLVSRPGQLCRSEQIWASAHPEESICVPPRDSLKELANLVRPLLRSQCPGYEVYSVRSDWEGPCLGWCLQEQTVARQGFSLPIVSEAELRGVPGPIQTEVARVCNQVRLGKRRDQNKSRLYTAIPGVQRALIIHLGRTYQQYWSARNLSIALWQGATTEANVRKHLSNLNKRLENSRSFLRVDNLPLVGYCLDSQAHR
ncbi:hypothetical protein ACFLZP_03480 [Patescibacteria group bacterium]